MAVNTAGELNNQKIYNWIIYLKNETFYTKMEEDTDEENLYESIY